MKKLTYIKQALLALICTFTISCSRADDGDDVLSQEDISNIILTVTDDASGAVQTCNYTVNSVNNPKIQLTDGKTYTVKTIFLNGNKDATQDIIDAKDEHFLVFNFPNSQIQLTRLDGANSTRTDGKKVGLLTKWIVIKAINGSAPQLNLTLIHDAVTVNEDQNGTAFGSVTGGETDALATYEISH